MKPHGTTNMKLRNGFVSNSSSSSFVISKAHLSPSQIDQIQRHIEVGKAFGMECANPYNRWDIHNDEDRLRGSTSMNNFDMGELLQRIGVPENAVEWSDY